MPSCAGVFLSAHPLIPKQLIAIYDAAFAADRWTEALEAFRSVTSAKGLILYEFSLREPSAEI